MYVPFANILQAREFPELSGKHVQPELVDGARIYLVIDKKPAYIDLNDQSRTVHMMSFHLNPEDLKTEDEIAFVFMNRYPAEENKLVIFAGTPEFTWYECLFDLDTGETQLLADESYPFALCWPSVTADGIYAGGVGMETHKVY